MAEVYCVVKDVDLVLQDELCQHYKKNIEEIWANVVILDFMELGVWFSSVDIFHGMLQGLFH